MFTKKLLKIMISSPYKIDNEILFNNHLKYMENRLINYTPTIPKKSDYVAMILELRNFEYMETILKTVIYYLNETKSKNKWGLQIFHGEKNKKQIESITKNWKNIQLVNLNINDITKLDYSNLLKTTDFWEKVNGKKILTFQTDSILLRSGIDEFLEFDYVGAPWKKSKDGYFVGNGGLSLRTKDRMIEITKEHNNITEEWEDTFFVKHLKGNGVADIETASRFSMEDVFYPNPLGIHNPIKINTNLLKKVLLF
jgi:hypothetical protein